MSASARDVHGQVFPDIVYHTSDILWHDVGSNRLKCSKLLHHRSNVICSPETDGIELALDSLDELALSMTGIKGKGFRGRILSATLSCKIHSYSLVRGTFTIMWMWSLSGCVRKILKTVLEGPNLSANFERSCPRSPIRSTRVSSGSAAIELESLS